MIKSNLTEKDFEQGAEALYTKLVAELLAMFALVGQRCMVEIERTQGYQNRTHNLTDSKGYGVVVDGELKFKTQFPTTKGGLRGQQLLSEIASKYNSGVGVILVAGEEYAEYVEAKGFNVLAAGELYAEQLVQKLLSELGYR